MLIKLEGKQILVVGAYEKKEHFSALYDKVQSKFTISSMLFLLHFLSR